MNSQINRTREHAGAETTNGSRRNLRKVDGTNDTSLTNSQTSNEATSIDSTHAAIVSNKNGDTENPETTELASSPDTTNPIADHEGTVIQIVLAKVPSRYE
jgi:hypothetical protein